MTPIFEMDSIAIEVDVALSSSMLKLLNGFQRSREVQDWLEVWNAEMPISKPW